MNDASSDSRKAIAAAISSARPRRPMGTIARERISPSLPGGLFSRNSSVSIGPGATALTVMPVVANSNAQPRVALIIQRRLGRGIRGALRCAERDQARDVDHAAPAVFAHAG